MRDSPETHDMIELHFILHYIEQSSQNGPFVVPAWQED